MIDVVGNPNLKRRKGKIPDPASAIDEFLSRPTDLGDMEMRRDIVSAGQEDGEIEARIFSESSFESRQFHKFEG